MKKKRASRLLSLVVSLCVAAVFCVIPAMEPSYADLEGQPLKYAKNVNVMYYPAGSDNTYYFEMGKKLDRAKKVTVSSSKKSVVAPGKNKYWPVIKIKAPGKAKVTIKVKEKKKTKKYTSTVTVLPYENPFQQLTIADLDLTSLFDNTVTAEYSVDQKTVGALNATLKDGWEFVDGSYDAMYFGTKDYEDVYYDLVNGKKVTLMTEASKWNVSISITLKNKELGITHYIELDNGYMFDE